jgi:hypothetical protein
MIRGQDQAADWSQISSSFPDWGDGNDGAVLAPTLSGK